MTTVRERHENVQMDEVRRVLVVPVASDKVQVKLEKDDAGTLVWVTSNRPENSALVMRQVLEGLDRASIAHDEVDYGEIGRPR